MRTRVTQFLHGLTLEEHPQIYKAKQEHLQVVFLAILGMTIVLGLVSELSGTHPITVSLLVFTGMLLIVNTLNQLRHPRAASALLIWSLLGIIQYNLAIGEGVRSVAVLALPMVVISAGLMFGSAAVPAFTLLALASPALAVWLPHALPVSIVRDLPFLGVVLVVMLGISVTIYYLLEKLEHALVTLENSRHELREAYETTLEGWARALELRDRETEGHSRHAAELAIRLAQAVGVSGEEELLSLRYGSLLHDIGKISVPDSILLKPGPLNKEEWRIMRKHPEVGVDFIADVEYLYFASDVVAYHHEHWDGSGYPKGLHGEEIPLLARIFAVIDVWEALTSDRPYRGRWSAEQALGYIEENSGALFDPNCAQVFVDMMRGVLTYSDLR